MIKEIKHQRTISKFKLYLESLTETVEDDIHPKYVTYFEKVNGVLCVVLTINVKYKQAYIYENTIYTVYIPGLDFDQRINIIDEWKELSKDGFKIFIL